MNVYMVWGRVPGAHAGITHIIAAPTAVKAEEAFADLLHEEYTENDLELVYHEHGATVFIYGCEQIGELVKIDGETLIRPVAGLIFGL